MNTQKGFIRMIVVAIVLVVLVSILTDFDPKMIWLKVIPVLDFLWGSMIKIIGLVIDITSYVLNKAGIGS